MKVNIHMCSQHFISIRTNKLISPRKRSDHNQNDLMAFSVLIIIADKGYLADVLLDLEVFGMTGSTGHFPEVEKIKIQLAPITNTLL